MKTFNKTIIPHLDFYITKFTRNPSMAYLIFIHGGPGLNSGNLEYLIEHNKLFDLLECNIILYDQRTCGRSKRTSSSVRHNDNVGDLQEILEYLNSMDIKISCLLGHSYGAKILYDYYTQYSSVIPGVFVSTAKSIITPRINNLILDLSYLKRRDQERYNEVLHNLNDLNLKKLWNLTEELSPTFLENIERQYLYWANLKYFEIFKSVQEKINLPINWDTFSSVRKDLYSNKSNFKIAIDNLKIPYLWVNGFQDFIIGGSEEIVSKNSKITIFYKSSHYPHIEENARFSELINEFLKNC